MLNFFKKFFTFDVRKTYYTVVENERDAINKRILELMEQRNKLEEMLGYR